MTDEKIMATIKPDGEYWQPEIETMPREQLEALQVKKLKASINVALQSPFYKKRLGDLGITADSINSLADLRKIPFTTKQDLRDNYPYGLVGRSLDDAIRIHSTSGTTGNLILTGCADEKKAIKGIPWGTLVFICGVGALVNVINKLGGIKLVSDYLSTLMSTNTAVPIMSATSGILSWVSSTTGVVMPALLPIAHNVSQTFGVSYVELMSAIVATSFAAAISPLSTGGAIIMSSYSASKETTTEEMNNMFKTLFLLSVANVLINVLMSWLGVFNLGHLFY